MSFDTNQKEGSNYWHTNGDDRTMNEEKKNKKMCVNGHEDGYNLAGLLIKPKETRDTKQKTRLDSVVTHISLNSAGAARSTFRATI